MRLFSKIFLCAALVLSMAVLFSGYLLITYSYENAITRERDRVLIQYQYDKFTVQSKLIAYARNQPERSIPDDLTLTNFATELNGQVTFFSEDRELLISDFPEYVPYTIFALLNEVSEDAIVHSIQTIDGNAYIMVCSRVTQSGISLYLLIATDIDPIVTQKHWMIQRFGYVYFITLGCSMMLIFALTAFITKPIKRLTKAAERIAHGNYNEDLSVSAKDEIGELSASFNKMTDAINDKIHALSENARQKEEFVANFSHELKTPLTSVIGYADMLYQKNLSPEEIKKASWFILNEGLRLEALSIKLMDLIVLNKQDFVLEEVLADELLQSVLDGFHPVMKEQNVKTQIIADPAYIKVEYDLFKTLLINLVDNAIKAGSTEIKIIGKNMQGCYCISVMDNGRGIPETELQKITEAFYTVDKSRSRKQHGVGLGLALAAKIAEIHGSVLLFESREHEGTVVKIKLHCERGGEDA